MVEIGATKANRPVLAIRGGCGCGDKDVSLHV